MADIICVEIADEYRLRESKVSEYSAKSNLYIGTSTVFSSVNPSSAEYELRELYPTAVM